MAFTSFLYLYFLLGFTVLFWIVRKRQLQNVLLLVASYAFYGWLTPWYCLLLGSTTILTYGCLLVLWKQTEIKKRWPVLLSVVFNVGLLLALKYWGFFIDDVALALKSAGWKVSNEVLTIIMPLGLSFYTLQAVGLTVDAYRGEVQRQSFLKIAVFLSFFPKLIAGPFEKAQSFFTQLAADRQFKAEYMESGFGLLLRGFLKKIVVAEGIAVYVNLIFAIEDPSWTLLAAAVIGFSIQILADFSGYTDLARGSAKLLGFDLMENFNFPYRSLTPSEFWRRWHISLSQWFRDYVYIPLGGSKDVGRGRLFVTLVITMGLSGAWHGVGTTYLLWGVYYGLLLFVYHCFGKAGHWAPQTRSGYAFAWLLMWIWTMIGWLLFRAPSIAWLRSVIENSALGFTTDQFVTAMVVLIIALLYALPWILLTCSEKFFENRPWAMGFVRSLIVLVIIVFGSQNPEDFIYFKF